MLTAIITTDDLREFKEELLEDIKAMINHQSGVTPKKWLKSPEVRDLLSISPGTLQNLRIVCSQIKLNFFAQNLREVSANLVKNFDTVFF